MIDTVPTISEVRYRSVLDMIREHATNTPEQTCLVSIDQNNSLTWRQLYRLTNRLSAWLHEMHVISNDRVLVLSNNSLENLFLYFGIQRHGATFCAVNVDINANHMAELVRRLKPKIVLYEDSLDIEKITSCSGGTWVPFGTIEATGNTTSDKGLFELLSNFDEYTEPEEVSTETDDAVICFTSGTTDRPKGVIHSFGNYNFIAEQTAYLWGLTPEDRVLEYRSFSWSSSHQIVLQPLLVGGGCVVFAAKFSTSQLFSWIRDYQITKAIGIPTVINMLLDRPIDEETGSLKTLEFMSCSTAPLMEEQHRRFEQLYGINLIQHYGMSEGGTVAGNHHLDRRIGSVGKPGIGQNLKILGEGGTELPLGEEGEIEIGGPQNATSLLESDGSIVPVRGKRLKTGDLGRLDESGYLRITGRAKELIIRGGVNIAPLEIDTVVSKHPLVREACTVGIPDPIYGEAIVCYVVARAGKTLLAADIDGHCKKFLPDFKHPKQIFITDKIAKNQRGKVDRNSMKRRWVEAEQKRKKDDQ